VKKQIMWKVEMIRAVIVISRKRWFHCIQFVVSNVCSHFPGEIQEKLFIFSMGFWIHQWGESFYLYIFIVFNLILLLVYLG